ncbi:MAG: helix-turn-helix domain-containing protein [Bacteroidetes bacterium]|nr:helix-turn-helix domain-containing protein [Bacteroidota bacterium]
MNTLQSYIPILDFLGAYLGPNTEISLFDTSKIIHTVNSIDDLKKVGMEIEDLELKFITEKGWETRDWVVNYRSLTKDKKQLRSATYFIKSADKKNLLGMITINMLVNDLMDMRRVLNLLINGFDTEEVVEHHEPRFLESFNNSFEDLMNNVIKEVVSRYNIPPDRLSAEEKLHIVRVLDSKGTFLIKGSVSEVAKILNSSEATIYRYLNQLSS